MSFKKDNLLHDFNYKIQSNKIDKVIPGTKKWVLTQIVLCITITQNQREKKEENTVNLQGLNTDYYLRQKPNFS